MQEIKNYLKKIINSKFIGDLSTVFIENIISRGLNFIIILLLTRSLGPQDYGKYSLIFVIMSFCAGFTDLGMENTAVRFSNKYKEYKNSIFGLYFLIKSITISFLILTIILFGKHIFSAFDKSQVVEYFPYLIAGILGESLLYVNDTYLQAIQKYKLRAIINISKYFISLTYILILIFNKILLLKYVFIIYFIPLFITMLFLPQYLKFLKAYFKNKPDKFLIKDIIKYGKWLFFLTIANTLLLRIDFIMLSFWVSFDHLGIYNAAFQLAAIVHFLPFVFGKVILPKVSELNASKINDFTRKLVKPLIILCSGLFLLVIFADLIVLFVFGEDYAQGINILRLLLIASIFNVLAVPYEQALFSIGKPKITALVKYSIIIFIIIFNILTIPKLGMIWAAINLTTGRIFITGILIILFTYRKEKEKVFV